MVHGLRHLGIGITVHRAAYAFRQFVFTSVMFRLLGFDNYGLICHH
jgi:hypothetical protein